MLHQGAVSSENDQTDFVFYFSNIVKEHVGILRWHSTKSEKGRRIWDKQLCRGGNFKVTMQTKVCSNHFAAGYCSDLFI